MNPINTAPTPTSTGPTRQIKPLDSKEFGKGAELKERLMAILKDVPALHQRLVNVTVEMEKTASDFKAATDRAQAIVDEWERLNSEERAKS